MRTAIALILLAGCARSPASDTPVSAAREAVPAEQGTVTPRAPDAPPAPRAELPADAPASADAISELLGARHAEDLPTREVLDRHEDPDRALAWLATNGASAAIRTRALRLLALYPDRDHGDLLAEYAAADQHPALRAAALDGLAGYEVAARADRADLIDASLSDDDPRVALAAVRAAEGVPELADALARAATEHPDARVREAAR